MDRLMGQLDGQTLIADRVFPSPARAMLAFTKQVLSTVVMDYATSLIDKTRQGSETDVYLKTVVGTYHQCQRLILYLNNPKDATKEFQNELAVYLDALYEPHIESYLRVESDYYRKCCDSVVDSWKKKVTEIWDSLIRRFKMKLMTLNPHHADTLFEKMTRQTSLPLSRK